MDLIFDNLFSKMVKYLKCLPDFKKVNLSRNIYYLKTKETQKSNKKIIVDGKILHEIHEFYFFD